MSVRAFVAGSHTDIGKTHVGCALIRAARARGLSAEALKPVASGFDPADWADSDPGRLLAALGRPLDLAHLEPMTPWRFAAPLAPPTSPWSAGLFISGADILTDGCNRNRAAFHQNKQAPFR